MRHFVLALFIVSCASTGDNAGCGSKPAPEPQEPERIYCNEGVETCREDICKKKGLMEGGRGWRDCLQAECVNSGGEPLQDGDICAGGLGLRDAVDPQSESLTGGERCLTEQYRACITCYVEPNHPDTAMSRGDHVCRGLENPRHLPFRRAREACLLGGKYVSGYPDDGPCKALHIPPYSETQQRCSTAWTTEAFLQGWREMRGCQ